MPTTSIQGITLDLPADQIALVQTWQDSLNRGATGLLGLAASADPKVKPILSTTGLAPIFTGLMGELSSVLSQLPAATPPSGAPSPLQSTVDDLVTRYLDSLVRALERILRDWDSLGPIFFTTGQGTDLAQYKVTALTSVSPEPNALRQGGHPNFVLALQITRADVANAPTLTAGLLYLPRDVAADNALVGDTTYLCTQGAQPTLCATTCGHVNCRSVAERVSAQLGETAAIPTLKYWPAGPAAIQGATGAYGYRELVAAGRPADITASSARSAEVADFARTLGRQLALAQAFGFRQVSSSDFVIHSLRPYWLDLATGFGAATPDLRSTGVFDAPDGPLAPPATVKPAPGTTPFGLVLASAPATALPLPPTEVSQGCRETLAALGALAGELTERFLQGPDLSSQYLPREEDQSWERVTTFLEQLSAASSWSDWRDLDTQINQWRSEDDEEWTRRWFGGLLSQIQASVTQWPQAGTEAAVELTSLRDEVTGLAGVRSLPELTIDVVLALPAPTRDRLWKLLASMATIIRGFTLGQDWESFVDLDHDILPVSVLLEYERVDHARARTPFFVRFLKSNALYSAVDNSEITLGATTVLAPPRPRRTTFFPEPALAAIARNLALLANPGVRTRLVTPIPQLMAGQLPPSTAVKPAGLSLGATGR